MIYKKGISARYIEGIEVVDRIKYLGLEIVNERDLFKGQRDIIIRKAENQIVRVRSNVERGFNKLEIGKLWWKNGVMPSVLVGIGVISLREEDIRKLQVLENGVYRQLLGGRKSTPIAILRGEVGSSMVKTRVIQSWLILAKRIQDGENILLKQVLGRIMDSGKGSWFTTFTRYLRDINASYDDLVRMDVSEVKARVRDYDNRKWIENLEELTDREVYKCFKKSVGRSFGYDNRFISELLFKARSNSLNLNDFRRHTGGDVSCELCGAGREDLEHFIFICPCLENFRDRGIVGGRDWVGASTVRIGNLLFDRARIEEVKLLLGSLWRERSSLLLRNRRRGGPG